MFSCWKHHLKIKQMLFSQIALFFKEMGREGRFCKHSYISAAIKPLVSSILFAAIILQIVQQACHDNGT